MHCRAELIRAEHDRVIRGREGKRVGDLAGLGPVLERVRDADHKPQHGHRRDRAQPPGRRKYGDAADHGEQERRQGDRAVAGGIRAAHHLADPDADEERHERDARQQQRRPTAGAAERDYDGEDHQCVVDEAEHDVEAERPGARPVERCVEHPRPAGRHVVVR